MWTYVDGDGKLCVDGMWHSLFEEEMAKAADRYRQKGDEHSAQILDRLAKTIDDVPTPIMSAYAELWTAWDEDLGDTNHTTMGRVIGLEAGMISDIARINPRNATEYVSEVLRRCGHGVLE